MSKKILLSFVLLAGTVVCAHAAQTLDQVSDTHMKRSIAELKKDSCDVNASKVQKWTTLNGTKQLVSVQFEGCGGGNNYGRVSFLVTQMNPNAKPITKKVNINNFKDVRTLTETIEVSYMDYAKDDPRCCPTLTKTTRF